MKKIADAVDKSISCNRCLQEVEDMLLAPYPERIRSKLRLTIRMTPQFSLHQHAVADACEWCELEQQHSEDTPVEIAKAAVVIFGERGVTMKSLEKAWLKCTRGGNQEVLALLAYRRTLRESTEDNSDDLNQYQSHPPPTN